jgi:hypothetical protein
VISLVNVVSWQLEGPPENKKGKGGNGRTKRKEGEQPPNCQLSYDRGHDAGHDIDNISVSQRTRF